MSKSWQIEHMFYINVFFTEDKRYKLQKKEKRKKDLSV